MISSLQILVLFAALASASLPRPSEWFRSKYSEWNKVVQLWRLGPGFAVEKHRWVCLSGIMTHKMLIVHGKPSSTTQPTDLR